MKKNITIAIIITIALAMLFMGIMETVLSSIGGTPAIVAAYSVIGIALIALYIKARKASQQQKDEEKGEDKE